MSCSDFFHLGPHRKIKTFTHNNLLLLFFSFATVFTNFTVFSTGSSTCVLQQPPFEISYQLQNMVLGAVFTTIKPELYFEKGNMVK